MGNKHSEYDIRRADFVVEDGQVTKFVFGPTGDHVGSIFEDGCYKLSRLSAKGDDIKDKVVTLLGFNSNDDTLNFDGITERIYTDTEFSPIGLRIGDKYKLSATRDEDEDLVLCSLHNAEQMPSV